MKKEDKTKEIIAEIAQLHADYASIRTELNGVIESSIEKMIGLRDAILQKQAELRETFPVMDPNVMAKTLDISRELVGKAMQSLPDRPTDKFSKIINEAEYQTIQQRQFDAYHSAKAAKPKAPAGGHWIIQAKTF